MSNMGKLGNTLTMLRLLESGRKYTVKELAERLEVTPRMIKSYKEELEKSGIYIESISGRYGGYIYHKDTHNNEIEFNYWDCDAIESILDKLDAYEVERISVPLEKIRSLVIYRVDEQKNITIDKEDIKNKYTLISKAIYNKSSLIFNYHNKKREFIPYTFTFYKDYVYITGFSVTDNDIKTLNLSMIKNLHIK